MARHTYPEPKVEEEDSLEEEDPDEDEKPDVKAAAVANPESEEEEENEDEEDEDDDDDDDMAGAGGGGSDSDTPAVVPLVVPLLDTKVLMRPQVWGIYGDWKDLNDAAGLAYLKGYERECYSYCLDHDKEERWLRAQEMRKNGVSEDQIIGLGLLNDDDDENDIRRGYGTVFDGKECFEFCLDMPGNNDNCKMRPSYIVGEFGDTSSWHGMYRFAPFREAEFFEFWRGNYATGVRGIIDPFDPDNPYGPQSAADFGELKKTTRGRSMKNTSVVSTNTTQASLNDNDISKISNVSQGDMTILEHDLEDDDNLSGCLYQKESVGPMGSILLSRSNSEVHQEIPVCPEGVYFDDAVAALKDFTKGSDLTKITSLKCHTNTWGLSANNWFADEMVTNMKSLTKFDLSDTVNYRHRSDLCMGIKSILMAAVTKNIQQIDLSDNFLDIDGGRAFAAFLAENRSLQVLKVNRCSLGLKATEQIVEALVKNHDLNLT